MNAAHARSHRGRVGARLQGQRQGHLPRQSGLHAAYHRTRTGRFHDQHLVHRRIATTTGSRLVQCVQGCCVECTYPPSHSMRYHSANHHRPPKVSQPNTAHTIFASTPYVLCSAERVFSPCSLVWRIPPKIGRSSWGMCRWDD